MNDRFEREESLFHAAAQLSRDAQKTFLKRECGEDAALHRRLEALLKSDNNATGLLEQPLVAQPPREEAAPSPKGEKPGDSIGRYKLLEKIGEGGCGIVYMAEQEEPVRRRVALKIIKLGMDTRHVVARFEAERQALAMMDHPNISKVLDAGASDTGRPFFVMELVRGKKITDYCDRERLSTRERLELFMQVCQAVQHAHQKGIIHRDLKPSNILVTLQDGAVTPKVIDFGIAKATTGQRLTNQTLFTAFEQFLGTPAYMSPEQAHLTSQDIDTRSDIYSLGVLLYELLTGKTPFDSKALLESGLEALQRTIRVVEPTRPSTRLSTMDGPELVMAARSRQIDPPRLISLVKGDLDWIVMTCLEKDRARRYATANGLALDIGRYLNSEPVAARPPSNLYRARKALQRHKLALGAVAAVLLGLIVSSLLYLREERDRARSKLSEAVAAERLQGAYLMQAQAGRWSKRAGRRFSGLDLLAKAAAIRPSLELRNEAIACMALTDMRPILPLDVDEMDGKKIGFDPNYERMAYVDSKATVHIRRLSDGSELEQFPGYELPFSYLEFSPDGQLLFFACGPKQNRAEVWDLRTKKMVLQSSEALFRTVDFSADNRFLALAYESQTNGHPVRIYDLASNQPAESPQPVASLKHTSLPFYVRFNPANPTVLLTSDGSREVRLWNWRSGELLRELAHPDRVFGIGWSPDGRTMATGCGDSLVRLWNVDEGYSLVGLLRGHDRDAVFVNFAGGGKLLASAGWDGRMLLWDVTDQREITRMPAEGKVGRFNPMGRKFDAWRGWKGSVVEAAEGYGYRLLRPKGLKGPANNCAFSPDGRVLMSGHLSGVCLWDSASGENIQECQQPGEGHFVLFHPNGQRVFVGSPDSILEWSILPATNRFRFDLSSERKWTTEAERSMLACDSAGTKLVMASGGAVSAIDLRAGLPVTRTAEANYKFATVSPNGRLAAAWSIMDNAFLYSTNCVVWDLKTTNLVRVLPTSRDIFAAFSPNNRWLAVGDSDQFRLWDVNTWQSLQTIPREIANYPGWLAFAPDSATMAVAITRSIVQLRETLSGRALATLEAPDEMEVAWIAFSLDGAKLAIACSTGAIQLWDLHAVRKQLAKMNLNWNSASFVSGSTFGK
jgi:serine/threonine protein kinase/WD40 repeat protein